MGETAHHSHSHSHNHNHQAPPGQAGPPPPVVAPPLGAARGPVYPPAEQLLQLNYCIHSNPSWGQYTSFLYIHADIHLFVYSLILHAFALPCDIVYFLRLICLLDIHLYITYMYVFEC